MLTAIICLTVMGITFGYLLGYAAVKLKVDNDPLLDDIIAMLPGSQCGQCGLPGCAGAAAALVAGTVPVTLCPPGGKALAEALAAKLGVSADLSEMEDSLPMVAQINELTCIGCTKCLKVCPTDAIVGAAKHIHGVLSEACTGCKQCVDICPTECLQMMPVTVSLSNWRWPKPAHAA